ncbi:MAG: Smr/MutS family protein [Spirochaetaceae bacterium]
MDDFEETLRKWEAQRREERKKNPMEEAIELYPPTKRIAKEKDSAALSGRKKAVAGRRLPVRELVDLHGLTSGEAIMLCEEAIRRNALPGEYRRILIIHGKGIHSVGGAKLLAVVRKYVKNHPLVGEIGVPPAKEGGDGAVWAVCRQRSR